MNIDDTALLNRIAKMGKDMTAGSNSMSVAMEKQRIIYVKEAMKRGLLGYPPKKKYIEVW
jgi:hypothetical protein